MYLTDKKCYLSGPIQYANDEFWRGEPIFNLKSQFNIDVFDPFADEKQQWTEKIINAKNNENVESLTKIAKSFVRKDLGMVDRSDFLIAYLPVGVQTVGTVHEIINSNNSKKPTMLVTNSKSICDIPLWYFGFIDSKYMFAGWNNLYSYLKDVNEGKHQDDDRWHLVYGIV